MLTGSRLLKEKRLLPGDFLGHLSICRRLYDLPELSCLTDDMPPVIVLDNPINVDISTRQDFRPSDQLSEDTLVFYTDGSKRCGCAGAGVYGPSCELYEPLGSTPSIFQAEIYALELCARYCLQSEDLNGRTIIILSDG